MTEHRYRAFSFVDRITTVETGRQATGTYTVPAHLPAFPISLVAEAVGQLAAWAAMEVVAFRSRPVAGLAGQLDLLADAQPGQALDLRAELETVSEDDVVYHGEARQSGRAVLRLRDCVGPMVPMADFDEPREVEARYALLRAAGVPAGSLGSAPEVVAERVAGQAGQWARAVLRVPTNAVLFQDHFPRQPVFPGTLLMHANLRLATELVGEIETPRPGAVWGARRVSDVKLRAFTPPGEVLELEARVARREAGAVTLTIETRKGTRVVASSQAHFLPEGGA
jgi:3-hydroxymyristoyl/3-hydroxydecanoyl-(acyl carrier protein) dehydratase